jgi:hypothetical protein
LTVGARKRITLGSQHLDAPTKPRSDAPAVPVRGSLRLSVTTSSPQVTAGTDFSIFVLIQNPFDVPITIYQVQTHIPVELIDVNGLRLHQAKRDKERQQRNASVGLLGLIKDNITDRTAHTGIAVAVGTDFNPKDEVDRQFINMTSTIGTMGDNSSMVGMQLNFPENPTSEELDRIFRRIDDYKKGLIPVTLQPGDSVVKQFVLRTRNWLFFTPLTHSFQIQVDYSSDGIDHADTVVYQQNIRAAMGAIAIGAVIGAAMGTILKSLTAPTPSGLAYTLRIISASIVASVAVVIAFARKSSAQPIVSVEDFWGGALIGFSVGFFGFEQFFGLFSKRTP